MPQLIGKITSLHLDDPRTDWISEAQKSLWDRAIEKLDSEDKQLLNFGQADKLTVIQDVWKAAEQRRKLCLDKRWKYRKETESIVLRDVMDKIIRWVDNFKQIGDIASQYDPVHAALPWAGVRFFLQVCSCSNALVCPNTKAVGG